MVVSESMFDGSLRRFYGKTGVIRVKLAEIQCRDMEIPAIAPSRNSTGVSRRQQVSTGINRHQQASKVADPADPAPAPDLAATAASFRT